MAQITSNIFMVQDGNGFSVQALRPKPGGGHKISFTASAAKNGTAFSDPTGFVELWATEDCFIVFGDSSVTAVADGSEKFLPANQWSPLYPLNGATHVSAVRAGASNGDLYVSEMD